MYSFAGIIGIAGIILMFFVIGYIYTEFDSFKSSYYSRNHNTKESIQKMLSNKNEFKDNLLVYNVITQFDKIYNGKNTREDKLKEIWKDRKVPYSKIENNYGKIEIYDAIQTDYLTMDDGYAFAEIDLEFENIRSTIYYNYATRNQEFKLVEDSSITFFIHQNKYVYWVDYFDKGSIKYKIRVYSDVKYFLETTPVKEISIVKRQ